MPECYLLLDKEVLIYLTRVGQFLYLGVLREEGVSGLCFWIVDLDLHLFKLIIINLDPTYVY